MHALGLFYQSAWKLLLGPAIFTLTCKFASLWPDEVRSCMRPQPIHHICMHLLCRMKTLRATNSRGASIWLYIALIMDDFGIYWIFFVTHLLSTYKLCKKRWCAQGCARLRASFCASRCVKTLLAQDPRKRGASDQIFPRKEVISMKRILNNARL